MPKLIITEDGQEPRILHDSGDILAFTDTLIKDESLWLYPIDKKEEISNWGNDIIQSLLEGNTPQKCS